jgi:hypothetical protein
MGTVPEFTKNYSRAVTDSMTDSMTPANSLPETDHQTVTDEHDSQ